MLRAPSAPHLPSPGWPLSRRAPGSPCIFPSTGKPILRLSSPRRGGGGCASTYPWSRACAIGGCASIRSPAGRVAGRSEYPSRTAPRVARGRPTLVRSHRRAPGRGGPTGPPAGNGRRLLRPRARLAASSAPLARSPLGGARFRLSARRIGLCAGPRRALGCLGDGIGSRVFIGAMDEALAAQIGTGLFSIDDLAARPSRRPPGTAYATIRRGTCSGTR